MRIKKRINRNIYLDQLAKLAALSIAEEVSESEILRRALDHYFKLVINVEIKDDKLKSR